MCCTCGTQFGVQEPPRCPVCEDARQYVPADGQRWTTLAELRRQHGNWIREDAGFVGIGTEPSFAIGQRALLVPHGDANVMWDCITLIRCGGHFAGGTVLHVGEVLLSGDVVQVIPYREWVSFMYSYPNLIPLAEDAICGIVDALEPFAFDRIVGAWWDRVVPHDGKGVVTRSAERYVRALRGEPLD